MAVLQTPDARVDLPAGWDGRISRFHPPAGSRAAADLGTRPGLLRLQAATRPLDGTIGDYGSGLVETLGRRDVFLAVLEHEPAAAGTVLFDRELSRTISQQDFDPNALQRTLPGQSGLQRFGTLAGRPVCLYVVLGSHAHRVRVVPVVEDVVRSLELS